MTLHKIYFYASLNLIVLGSCRQKTPVPETFLIPQGFTGRVNIIFNRKDGTIQKFEDGRRVYTIPPSGILLTQFKDEYGIVDHQYFYVDSSGKRTALSIFKDSATDFNQTAIGIFLDGTTGQYGKMPKAVWWQEFVVASYRNVDSFFTLEYKKQFENRLTKEIGVEVNIP